MTDGRRRMWIIGALSLVFSTQPGSALAQESADENGALTLDATRIIAFTTTEGTYMDLDVSPDGQTIVFDLVGDIYTVSIEGGDATRLTSGMPYDIQPTYSPDGSEIAFISDKSGSDNIWVMNADGSEARAMTTEKDDAVSTPEWSPDGEYLVARRARELWLYHREGGSGLELSSHELASGVTGPKFSENGRYVFFSSRQGGGVGIAGFTDWQVRRLDRNTGDVATITASPNGAYRPALSPDGRWLVYGARLDAKTGLRVRDLQTDRERWLVFDIDRDNAERAGTLDLMPRFTFTPDSREVVLATGGTFHRFDVDDGTDRVISFSADIEQQLAPLVFFDFPYDAGPLQVRNIRYANRDPTGERLVYSALGQIWIQRAEDGTPSPILDGQTGQFQPVFSPDGMHIVYVTWDDVEGGHVWRMPLRGTTPGEPVRLTEHAGYYQHPAWSPDGNRIAFIKEDAAAFRNIWSRNTGILVWIDADGSPLTEVTSAPSDNRLTFSPDGERISYVADVTGGGQGSTTKSQLVSVRVDGTDKRTLAEINAETYEAVPSPDGRWVAFGVREDIYLAALPLSSEVPSIGESQGPGPVTRVTREGGVDIHWESDGESIGWTFANTFHHISVDSVFAWSQDTDNDAEEDESEGDEGDGQDEAESGPQPQTIDVQLTAERYQPSGTIALVGASVITMENDQPLEDATVLVTNNRITKVGPRSSVDIPGNAEVIDVTGKYIMPGMIDLHAHLRQPREVFAQTTWSYLANLAYGVTTSREVSSSNDSFAYSEMIESGAVLGPRLYSTGRAMTTTNAKIESLEDARSLLRHYKSMGATVIKQYMQPHRRQRQWVIQAAMEEGINATNEGGGDFRLNMTQMYDGYTGIEHSLPLADLYDDVIQLFAQSKTWYTPTLVVSYGGPTAEWYFYQTTEVHDDEKLARFTPHDDLDRRTRRGQLNRIEEYHFPAVARGAARILQAGGNVGMGAHGEQQGIGAHWELWGLQMGGLSNFDALRTVTTMGAEGLGMASDLGTVTAGKLADLIVLDANPLFDIRNSNTVHMVMKNGELFDGDTLEKIWPERSARPPLGYRAPREPGR